MHKEGERLFLLAVLAFMIVVLGLAELGILMALRALLPHLMGILVGLTALGILIFVFVYLRLVPSDDPCAICWEAFSQAVLALQQALGSRDRERGRELYERGIGALEMAKATEPHCHTLQEALGKLTAKAKPEDEGLWRADANYRIGVLTAVSPFLIPPVRWAIWMQGLWQVLAIVLSSAAMLAAWQGIVPKPLAYAGGGGMLGATIYNLLTLGDHIAVHRDYSTRFWVDYLMRPLLGGVLGIVVYAALAGLVWTLTLPGQVNPHAPKVVFFFGLLSGFALRSVLTWLGGIAKMVFRPAPSPAELEAPEERR